MPRDTSEESYSLVAVIRGDLPLKLEEKQLFHIVRHNQEHISKNQLELLCNSLNQDAGNAVFKFTDCFWPLIILMMLDTIVLMIMPLLNLPEIYYYVIIWGIIIISALFSLHSCKNRKFLVADEIRRKVDELNRNEYIPSGFNLKYQFEQYQTCDFMQIQIFKIGQVANAPGDSSRDQVTIPLPAYSPREELGESAIELNGLEETDLGIRQPLGESDPSKPPEYAHIENIS